MTQSSKKPARGRGPAAGSALPTQEDEQHLRMARNQARAQIAAIDEMVRYMRRAVFHVELTAIIRAASPFLIALLEYETYSLPEVVARMEPMPAWPRRPYLSSGGASGAIKGAHMLRHLAAGNARRGPSAFLRRPSTHSLTIARSAGGWIRVEIIGRALEVVAEIGPERFETQAGKLMIVLPGDLPDTLAVGCFGRPVEHVVDHEALRGRGWTIAAIENQPYAFSGTGLIVDTGSAPFRIADRVGQG